MDKRRVEELESQYKNEVLEGCPECNGRDVNYYGENYEGSLMRQALKCNECHAEWEEFYRWDGIKMQAEKPLTDLEIAEKICNRPDVQPPTAKTIKVYHINVTEKTITLVEIADRPDQKLTDLQALAGGYIEAINYPMPDHHVYVDEEARLKDDGLGMFSFGGAGPYVGNGVVCGHNKVGASITPTLTIDYIKRKVKFL